MAWPPAARQSSRGSRPSTERVDIAEALKKVLREHLPALDEAAISFTDGATLVAPNKRARQDILDH